MYRYASCCRYSKWLPLACFTSALASSSKPSRSVMTVSSLPCIPRVALNQSLISRSLSVTCSIGLRLLFDYPVFALGMGLPEDLEKLLGQPLVHGCANRFPFDHPPLDNVSIRLPVCYV